MKPTLPLVTIVVPCYNEQEVLKDTITQLSSVLDDLRKEELISAHSKILFVDDGSKDRTWPLIAMESTINSYVTGLKLSCNVGHQKALLAGLEKAKSKSDCVISIDADLQDDVSVIRSFLLKYHEGDEIVYGVRDSRETDTFFKRNTALCFYRLMQKLNINLIYNHADYRLMSKRAIEELSRYKEADLFLRGIVPLIGFKSSKVTYNRKERLAGETKYPLKKMVSFAFNGLTSFSVVPIRAFTFLGCVLLFISVITGGYAFIQKSLGHTSIGWTSLIISIWLLGAVQLISIGVVGEYIGKIFIEVKKRPPYAIDIDLYTERLGVSTLAEESLLTKEEFN
ncbi:glycosyltransferase family 2 protein [Priestia megaterium]|uniref:glycosyltransferase family 2 protein n=1 Tax=Priestia megaterium TaxID=1404 RepID=UPI0021C1935B|nr:glycosyltransferase family 2 protein [Priestia megaterium]MCT9851981.1 glycosyltransferase family 2 protein [Priestia megaterium]MDF1964412.1 glycosyltransferase family 2 protein [Priestia megaterium]MDF2012607.1 glycosyltransferase family 2 protein [Priestia megaterium]